MTSTRHFDTVAFDVRDNAAMLFFADTRRSGDIRSYLLLMRAEGENADGNLYLEIDETQLIGERVVETAELAGNELRLTLHEDAADTFGDNEFVLTFEDNDHNRAGIESGALRVLGEVLSGGEA